jgi:hypothetical protein
LKAVVLELVQPSIAGRDLGGERRLARDDESGRLEALRPDPAVMGTHSTMEEL